MITRWVLACALAFSLTVDVAAAKPVFSVKSRVFEGKIEIDAKLRPFAKLRAFLLAEGKRGLAAVKKGADELGVEGLGTYKNHAWTDDVTFTLRSNVSPIICVLRRDAIDMGGAHPNTEVATTMWDRNAERPLALGDLFVEAAEGGPTLTALAKLIRDDFAAERRKDGLEVADDPATDSMLKRVEARIDKLGSPSLAPSTVPGKASGLTFHFSPYAVAGFADGVQVAFVPGQAILPLLKPRLRPLFGGDRPESDTKDQQ
jgi:hypothetical protein